MDKMLSQADKYAYKEMKQRCYNPNNKGYHNYGGRGIKVCDRWLESFDNFYADMGPRPEGMSLERIDNDGDYSPENCRWATQSEQLANQRKTVRYGGKTRIEWAELLEVENLASFRSYCIRYGDAEAVEHYIKKYGDKARIDELKRLRANHDEDVNYYSEIMQREIQLKAEAAQKGEQEWVA